MAGKRLLPNVLLVAASLGTAALIESCYECFGLDGDPVDLSRAFLLGGVTLGCAAIVMALVARSCSRCDNGRYRTYLQRELFDRLPFDGMGLRFTAIVALLQSICMALVQLGDPAPNAREDLIGWGTSLLLVLVGTIVVRCLLRLMPRLAPLIAEFFIGISRPRPPTRSDAVLRSRPIAGCDSWPRIMFKRPPPHPLHA